MINIAKLNLVLAIIGVVLGVIVWNTASQVLTILILIDLLVIGANLTGLTAYLLSRFKKEDSVSTSNTVKPTKSLNENEI